MMGDISGFLKLQAVRIQQEVIDTYSQDSVIVFDFLFEIFASFAAFLDYAAKLPTSSPEGRGRVSFVFHKEREYPKVC